VTFHPVAIRDPRFSSLQIPTSHFVFLTRTTTG
jgi:hypothetical protein